MKTRVLHLDDDATQIRILEITIRHESDLEHVGSARDARELWEALEKRAVDVLVMDLGMPEEPLAIIAEIRRRFPNLKIIVYSGYDFPETIEATLAAGASGHIAKGGDIEKLLAAIRNSAGTLPVKPSL